MNNKFGTAVELINISKIYAQGAIANKNINLTVNYGEIHAILGENGAGKSTLMKTIFGLVQPTTGTIKVNNEVVRITSPNVATGLGIGMVQQHFQLINNFSVLENIILGYELKNKVTINNVGAFFNIYLDYLEHLTAAKISKISGDVSGYQNQKLTAKMVFLKKRDDYRVLKKRVRLENSNKNPEQTAKQLLKIEKYQKLCSQKQAQFNAKIKRYLAKVESKQQKKIIPNQNPIIINSKINAFKKRVDFYYRLFYCLKRTWEKRFWLNYQDTKKNIQDLCQKMQFKINLKAKVASLSVYEQQKVEILKVLYRDAKILILDEPTGILTPQEITDLLKRLVQFKKEGKAIIVITHKLQEIIDVADRCTIIRNGEYIATVDVKTTTANELATLMVGRKVNLVFPKKPVATTAELLKLTKVTTVNKFKISILKEFSLSIKGGEILGIAGVEGNGQDDIIKVICGHLKPTMGQVTFYPPLTKTPVNLLTLMPKDIYNLGIHLIPADRQKEGLILKMKIWENVSLRDQFNKQFNKKGFLKIKDIKLKTKKIVSAFDIRGANSIETEARALSGGNQQKLVIGRELSENPHLIIAVQPTRGLDVGAIEIIYQYFLEQRNQGNTILLISSELDEIINLSDRVVTVNNGANMGELVGAEINREKIGLMMAGVKNKNDQV